MAYFSHHCLKRPRAGRLVSFVSRTFWILTRHLSCSLLTRSSAAPITVMMMLATMANTPSQMFSAASKALWPAV
jgi:hypothetical protein